jgi:hypothetical protein
MLNIVMPSVIMLNAVAPFNITGPVLNSYKVGVLFGVSKSKKVDIIFNFFPTCLVVVMLLQLNSFCLFFSFSVQVQTKNLPGYSQKVLRPSKDCSNGKGALTKTI